MHTWCMHMHVHLADADASVLDGNVEAQVVCKLRLQRRSHHDAPLRRELDGVEKQVEEHLPDTSGVRVRARVGVRAVCRMQVG